MLTATERREREAEFASMINHEFPELAAILDQKMGVLIYPEQAVAEGRQFDWVMAVSANDTSLGDIMTYNFNQEVAQDEIANDDLVNQLSDEVVKFVYGGMKNAAK